MTSGLAEITGCCAISWKREVAHSVDRVWQCITEPDDVEAWLGAPATIEPRLGGRYIHHFGRPINGVIVAIEAPRLLTYSWANTSTPADSHVSVVRWQLEPTARGTAYRFTHHGLNPGDPYALAGLVAGWHGFLDQLGHFFDHGASQPIGPNLGEEGACPLCGEVVWSLAGPVRDEIHGQSLYADALTSWISNTPTDFDGWPPESAPR